MRDDVTASEKADTVKRTQLTLIAAGIFLLAVGVFLSPDSLKAVGIMRRTLESDIEMVRRTALLEVYVMQVLCSLLQSTIGPSTACSPRPHHL